MWQHLNQSLYTIFFPCILILGGTYVSGCPMLATGTGEPLMLTSYKQRPLCLLIQSITNMQNFKNKFSIGNVVNNNSHLKVSPNLNTFALTYCGVRSFNMLHLLGKACRVHSHLFCRGLDFYH